MDQAVILANYKGTLVYFKGPGMYYRTRDLRWHRAPLSWITALHDKGTETETISVTDLEHAKYKLSIKSFSAVCYWGSGGFKISCSCGATWTTSLSRVTAELQAQDHWIWHQNQDAKRLSDAPRS